MNLPSASRDGSELVTDERINTITHLAACIFALFGCALLIVKASADAKVWHIVSFSIYAAGLIGLFLASTLHHGIQGTPKVNKTLRIIDYVWIFVLIAATFNPICLVPLRGAVGWTAFGVVWGVAIIGILLKVLKPNVPKWVTTTMYISMGWLGLAIAWPLIQAVPWWGVAIVALGGIFYTVGGFIFATEKTEPCSRRVRVPRDLAPVRHRRRIQPLSVHAGLCVTGCVKWWDTSTKAANENRRIQTCAAPRRRCLSNKLRCWEVARR